MGKNGREDDLILLHATVSDSDQRASYKKEASLMI